MFIIIYLVYCRLSQFDDIYLYPDNINRYTDKCIKKPVNNGLFLVPNLYTFSITQRNSSLYFPQFLWIIKLYLIYTPQVVRVI